MLGTLGQFGGERPRAAPDIKHPRTRARQLPQEQPVAVGIVVPVQLPPSVPLPRPPDAETADARACRPTGRNDPGARLPALSAFSFSSCLRAGLGNITSLDCIVRRRDARRACRGECWCARGPRLPRRRHGRTRRDSGRPRRRLHQPRFPRPPPDHPTPNTSPAPAADPLGAPADATAPPEGHHPGHDR